MEIHYKATVWVAMKFSDEVTKEEIIERLEKGEMPLDIGNQFDCDYYENMTETEEYVTLEENDGQSTIEVFDDFDKCVWDNSFESELERKRKNPYKAAIWWSVEDFAGMAEQQFELLTYYSENSPVSVQERAKRILSTCKDWKDYYDESKFEEALDRMIHKHDAEYGITWESIKYYLNAMCVKEEQEENE